MNEPYQLTVGVAIAAAVWLLALTVMTLTNWFKHGTDEKDQSGKTAQTRNVPAKAPQRPQEPRKPPPPSTDTPETVLSPLKGSGPLPPNRDRPPPPPAPKQWLEEHQPTQQMRAVQPETNPEPATEQIRPSRRPAGQWAEDQHGNWSYNPEERK